MSFLDLSQCRTRRQRLIDLLEANQLRSAILTDHRDIYYFLGTLLPADLPLLLLIDSQGKSVLVGPEDNAVEGVDDHHVYSWNVQGTRHPDPMVCLVEVAKQLDGASTKGRVGIQSESLTNAVRDNVCDESSVVPIDDQLRNMQSRKDADEIELIRESIRANLGAYDAVQQAIHPGISELEVLAAGIQGAMTTAGEKVFHDGDYQCGEFNGPARNRAIERGELYIVDAWTTYRGYWSDMSRTFVVGVEPTDSQQALFDHIRWVQSEIPNLLRPNVDGAEVFASLDGMIRSHPPLADKGLVHHGGHSIGLRAHEMPDINRDRGGVFEPGNIVCVEPGGYFEAARHGVRLENMYLITEKGCEDLCPGEIALHRCG